MCIHSHFNNVCVAALASSPTTPPNDQEWIAAYMTIHQLSKPSWRVAYLLWFTILFVFVLASFLHYLGASNTVLGAYWLKWALRRRTWRKKHSLAVAQRKGKPHRQPLSLPANAQLLSLFLLLSVTLVLCFAGPDYIAPNVGVFDFTNRAPVASRTFSFSQFFPFQAHNTTPKAWWTVGGRTGLIASALFPLCVLTALKAPPIAVFAIPFSIQFHFDKLSAIHRWSGRLIWFIVVIHVVAWSVQLAKDPGAATHKSAYSYAWSYSYFINAWIAFILLTLIIVLSIRPIRKRCYNVFWFLHICLVPSMLVASALHFPPLQWWAYGALLIWVCERLWRGTWWLYTNGSFGKMTPNRPFQPSPFESRTLSIYDGPRPMLSATVDELISPSTSYIPPQGYAHVELMSGRTVRIKIVTPGYIPWSPGQHCLINIPAVSKLSSHPFTIASICDEQSRNDSGRVLIFLVRVKTGWTKDLWDTVVRFMIRGQNKPQSETLPPGSHLPERGVLMRAFVEGPFGSTVRENFNKHQTVLIVAGGSGVSFALSILEYLCLCMSGRNGKYLGGSGSTFSVSRVRFVWLVRDFCHIQWGASILCRCLSLVNEPRLKIDIFVSNLQSLQLSQKSAVYPPLSALEQSWDPPLYSHDHASGHVQFAEGKTPLESPNWTKDDDTYGGLLDLSYYYDAGKDEESGWEGGGEHELDMTNFDGDDDTQLPGEGQLSRRFKEEGMMRRAISRSRRSRVRPEGYEDASTVRLVAIREEKDEILRPKPMLRMNTGRAAQSLLTDPSSPSSQSHSPGGVSILGAKSDIDDIYELIPKMHVGAFGEEVRIDVDEREAHDISVVAEHARSGRPKLDLLLEEEVESSRGNVLVACCGPTSLIVGMRKHVAAQIDPGRIWKGDRRGCISLVSEDFEF